MEITTSMPWSPLVQKDDLGEGSGYGPACARFHCALCGVAAGRGMRDVKHNPLYPCSGYGGMSLMKFFLECPNESGGRRGRILRRDRGAQAHGCDGS